MVRCLKRARNRYDLLPEVRLQLAILLDRTGYFRESRAEFTDALLADLDESEELAVILAASGSRPATIALPKPASKRCVAAPIASPR